MRKEIEITIPTDENGFVGRECPNPKCGKYFKMKFGTGLPISICKCPYCTYGDDHENFFTQNQIEYIQSVTVNKLIGRELAELKRSFEELERRTRNGLVRFKVETKGIPLRTKYYKELEVETNVICDSCGLEFAIYGVFATCPACGKLNASIVFSKSIEVAKKRLVLTESLTDIEPELVNAMLEDSLSAGVSAFDAFGKALRGTYPNIFPDKPKNLFQNIHILSEIMFHNLGLSLEKMGTEKEIEMLYKMFQVRHIYEHNLGVVDDVFIKKVPDSFRLKGRKYLLDRNEIEKFLDFLEKIGLEIVKNILKINNE